MDGGSLEIHTEVTPTSGDTLVSSGAALVAFTFPTPAFQPPTASADTATVVAVVDTISEATVANTGTASFAVIRDNGGTQLHILSVYLVIGTGSIRLSTLDLTSGETLSAGMASWTHPTGNVSIDLAS